MVIMQEVNTFWSITRSGYLTAMLSLMSQRVVSLFLIAGYALVALGATADCGCIRAEGQPATACCVAEQSEVSCCGCCAESSESCCGCCDNEEPVAAGTQFTGCNCGAPDETPAVPVLPDNLRTSAELCEASLVEMVVALEPERSVPLLSEPGISPAGPTLLVLNCIWQT